VRWVAHGAQRRRLLEPLLPELLHALEALPDGTHLLY